jgi:hypothetical protein
MQGGHPTWGARRIEAELGRVAAAAPSRATVHGILERDGLVVAQEQQRRRKYTRWQPEAPMHLWQLDLVGGIFLPTAGSASADRHRRSFLVRRRTPSVWHPPGTRALTGC